MYCTKCGVKNQDSAVFCIKCGNRIIVENAEPSSNPELNSITKETNDSNIKTVDVKIPSNESFYTKAETSRYSSAKIGENYESTLKHYVVNNSAYYLEQFKSIEANNKGSINWTWLISGLWLLYRKMYAYFFLTLIPIANIYFLINLIFNSNKIYYNFICKKIEKDGMTGKDIENQQDNISIAKKHGGTSYVGIVIFLAIGILVPTILSSIMMSYISSLDDDLYSYNDFSDNRNDDFSKNKTKDNTNKNNQNYDVYIDLVRHGHDFSETRKIGESFDSFFAQTKWLAFQDNDYENFMSNYVNDSDSYLGAVENNIHVVCIGNYANNDYFQNNEIIFIYTVDKDYNFSLWDVIIDGEEYEHFQRPVLIEAIYPEFGSDGIADEEMLIDNAKYKVALLLNGNLGDKSFFDSAHEGLQSLKDELGKDEFSFKVVEMGATPSDEASWWPTLMEYCDSEKYDIIIAGTWQMANILSDAAERYPNQKFIFFDEIFDFDAFNSRFETGQAPKNIYNVLYKSNEVSFLVGATAAMMTTDSNMNMIDSSNKKIGFIGGMETAFIHDHLIGYLQGAKYIDSDIEIAIDYIGNFYDSAAGKDLAIRQYADGVDVGFNVAGGAGLGQIEAAYDAGKWAFGIDANQATLLPNIANNIPTSAIKNIGNSLIRAIKLDINGYLKYGIIELVGLKEGCVGLVKDSHYENTIPKYIRETVDKLESDIINGSIVVDTSLNKNSRDAKALIERIR